MTAGHSKADLIVFHVPAHKLSTAPGTQKAEALAENTWFSNWPISGHYRSVIFKNGHHGTQAGWHIDKENVLGNGSGVNKGLGSKALVLLFQHYSSKCWNSKKLEKLNTMSRYPHQIANDLRSHFKGHDTQEWKEHNTEWRFHLPYNPQTAGLVEPRNGFLKPQI